MISAMYGIPTELLEIQIDFEGPVRKSYFSLCFETITASLKSSSPNGPNGIGERYSASFANVSPESLYPVQSDMGSAPNDK